MYYRFESIKQLRKNLKKTQEEMSDMLGMSARNYREKECGKLCPDEYESYFRGIFD